MADGPRFFEEPPTCCIGAAPVRPALDGRGPDIFALAQAVHLAARETALPLAVGQGLLQAAELQQMREIAKRLEYFTPQR